MGKQKVRICVDLNKFNEGVQIEKHDPDTRENGRGKSVHEARRQFRVLANTSLAHFITTYHVHHSIREVLLSKATLCDHIMIGVLPEEDE